MKRILSLIFLVFTATLVFSQSKVAQKDNFPAFINHFLKTCFWGQNIDSLAFHASPQFTQFLEPSIGFGRYWNPGAYCCFYGSTKYSIEAYGEWSTETMPQYTVVPFFANKMPVDGLCEESKDPDGVYYCAIKELPPYPDMWSGDELSLCYPNIPEKFKHCKQMEVIVLLNHFITKHFYCIQVGAKWYVTFFYDCDCSA
jgi:hypothetical protein